MPARWWHAVISKTHNSILWESDYEHQMPKDKVWTFHPMRSNFPRNPLCTLSSTSPCSHQGYEVQISQEIHSVHYHPHLHVATKDMKYMTARFPLLQFLDLKCCYVYLSTSLEAVNDDNNELSHQDLHMRCKYLSLHGNCKVYVVPTHAMQYIFIILNHGTRWRVVTLKMWPFYFHGPLTHALLDRCQCWCERFGEHKNLLSLVAFKTCIIQLVTTLRYLGSKQRQQTETIQKARSMW